MGLTIARFGMTPLAFSLGDYSPRIGEFLDELLPCFPEFPVNHGKCDVTKEYNTSFRQPLGNYWGGLCDNQQEQEEKTRQGQTGQQNTKRRNVICASTFTLQHK
jgi:hypothetical protein